MVLPHLATPHKMPVIRDRRLVDASISMSEIYDNTTYPKQPMGAQSIERPFIEVAVETHVAKSQEVLRELENFAARYFGVYSSPTKSEPQEAPDGVLPIARHKLACAYDDLVEMLDLIQRIKNNL